MDVIFSEKILLSIVLVPSMWTLYGFLMYLLTDMDGLHQHRHGGVGRGSVEKYLAVLDESSIQREAEAVGFACDEEVAACRFEAFHSEDGTKA